MTQATKTSQIINASLQSVYDAITHPESLEIWQAPGDMTAKLHDFDFRVGGGYEMSLYYPESEKESRGKTHAKEDRYTVRFVEIIPNEKLVYVLNFKSSNPEFLGDMLVKITLVSVAQATEVTFSFKNIPVGIRPEDNKVGTKSSLQKLADYVENER